MFTLLKYPVSFSSFLKDSVILIRSIFSSFILFSIWSFWRRHDWISTFNSILCEFCCPPIGYRKTKKYFKILKKKILTFNFGSDFFFRWSQIGFNPGTRRLPSDEGVTRDPWTDDRPLSLINQMTYCPISESSRSVSIWCFNSFSPLSLSWLKIAWAVKRANQRSEIDENEREFRRWKLLLSGACRDQENPHWRTILKKNSRLVQWVLWVWVIHNESFRKNGSKFKR